MSEARGRSRTRKERMDVEEGEEGEAMDVDGERAAKKMRMASRSRSQSVPRDVAGHAYKDKTQQEKAKKVRSMFLAPPHAQLLADYQEGRQERNEGEGQGDGEEGRGRQACAQLHAEASLHRQARDRQDRSSLRSCGRSRKLVSQEERSRPTCPHAQASPFVYPHLVKIVSHLLAPPTSSVPVPLRSF
eukprot:753252-Hanusia_phi.AAC.2